MKMRPPASGHAGPGRRHERERTDVRPLRAALLAHYDSGRRDLPWRGETDPYRVLVSEVMLQQTRAETVKGYYGAWLRRFPDLESLAAADVDEVLEAWAGLGYYRRARNLHLAARLVRERARPRRPTRLSLPSSAAALRALPGVGEYTAGAVASIAFGEPVAAADGNVRRVLARLFDVADPKPAWLRTEAAALVDPERPGDWNQALMDLGATVCTPARPSCAACPIASWCRARDHGTQEARPEPARKREVPARLLALAVLVRAGRVMLARRPVDGLLGGMWAFPEREVRDEAEAAAGVLEIARAMGLVPGNAPVSLPVVVHRFTHLHATYVPWLVEVAETNRAHGKGRDRRWIRPLASGRLALPAAQKRVLDSVAARVASAPPRPTATGRAT